MPWFLPRKGLDLNMMMPLFHTKNVGVHGPGARNIHEFIWTSFAKRQQNRRIPLESNLEKVPGGTLSKDLTLEREAHAAHAVRCAHVTALQKGAKQAAHKCLLLRAKECWQIFQFRWGPAAAVGDFVFVRPAGRSNYSLEGWKVVHSASPGKTQVVFVFLVILCILSVKPQSFCKLGEKKWADQLDDSKSVPWKNGVSPCPSN